MEHINNIDIKVEYFKEYWKYFTATTKDNINNMYYFENLEQDSINPLLFNPQFLIKEFIDELEITKDLTKSFYKDFFRTNISKLVKGEFIENKLSLNSLEFLQSNLKLAQKYFSPKDAGSYSSLLYTLKFILYELKDFKLGIECIKELSQILTDNSNIENSKEKIKALTNFIIFELRNKKYSDKTIKEIISNIFSVYNFSKDKGLYTKFPHNIKFITDENLEEYYKKVMKYIDDLTIEDRILTLETYFKQEPKEVIFIFHTKGLKYDKSFEEINGIKIYNPSYKQLINNDEKESYKKLELNPNFNPNVRTFPDGFCNIAIQINMIDFEYSKSEAIYKINKFFGILTLRYFTLKNELNIITNSIIVIDKNGKVLISSSSIETKNILVNGIDLEDFKHPENYFEYYSNLINVQNLDKIDRKIIESTNWKIKALKSNNYNESILWHWVSIENLFEIDKKNVNNILNFAPQILTKSYIHNFMQQIINIIHSKESNFLPFYNDISKEANDFIKEEMRDKKFTYNEFICKVKELLNILSKIEKDKNTFFYERLNHFICIFSEDKQFLNFIKNYQEQIKQKILFLYRIRNKIVHNANNEQDSMVIYYRNFASYLNTVLLCYFIDKRIEGIKDNKEIFYSGEYEMQKIKEKGLKAILNNE